MVIISIGTIFSGKGEVEDWRDWDEVNRIRMALITLSKGRLGRRRLNDLARLAEGLVERSAEYKANRR